MKDFYLSTRVKIKFWHRIYSGNVTGDNLLYFKWCQIVATVVARAQLCVRLQKSFHVLHLVVHSLFSTVFLPHLPALLKFFFFHRFLSIKFCSFHTIHCPLSNFNFCIALVQHNIFFTFICMNDFRQQTNLYKSSPLIWLFLFVCIFTIPLLVQYSCMLQQLSNSSFGTVEGYQQQIYNSSYGSAAGEQFAFIFPRYFLLKLFSSCVIFATAFLFLSFHQ